MSSRASQSHLKRLLDVVLAGTALLATLPVIAVAALAIRVAMGPPVLFRQVRPGYRGEPFTLYKFRTMDAGPGGDDERITRLGRFLRATSIDELPQLWNVLRAEMSLVGPRPLLTEYLNRYTPRQRRRHEARPGITGLAQVTGRNQLPWEEQLELDVRYVERWSLGLDLIILMRTVGRVLSGHGISQPGRATRERFGEGERERGSAALTDESE